MFIAFGVTEQSAGAQAEQAHQAEQREAAAGFLDGGLRISGLVFGCIGQTQGGAV